MRVQRRRFTSLLLTTPLGDGSRPQRVGAGRRGPCVLPRGQDRLAAGQGPVAHDRPEQAPVHRIAAAAHPRVQAPDRHQCRVPDPARGGILHQAGRRSLAAARGVLGHHDRPGPQLAVRAAELDPAARRLPQQSEADRSELVQARRLLSGADRGQPLERQDRRRRRRGPALLAFRCSRRATSWPTARTSSTSTTSRCRRPSKRWPRRRGW